jgi:hypothetical protein
MPEPCRGCGPDSVVVIATGYVLDGPGIESRWGARISAPVQTELGAHPTSCKLGTGSFPGVKSGRGATLTPHPLLMLWVRKGRAISLLPLWAVRPVQSLNACTKVTFTIFTCRGWQNKLRINGASSWFLLHRYVEMQVNKTLNFFFFIVVMFRGWDLFPNSVDNGMFLFIRSKQCTYAETCNLRNRCVVIDGLLNQYLHLNSVSTSQRTPSVSITTPTSSWYLGGGGGAPSIFY